MNELISSSLLSHSHIGHGGASYPRTESISRSVVVRASNISLGLTTSNWWASECMEKVGEGWVSDDEICTVTGRIFRISLHFTTDLHLEPCLCQYGYTAHEWGGGRVWCERASQYYRTMDEQPNSPWGGANSTLPYLNMWQCAKDFPTKSSALHLISTQPPFTGTVIVSLQSPISQSSWDWLPPDRLLLIIWKWFTL